jgi:phage replication-related protein YjqB (UPF0714/DUF867 family)
MGSDKYMNLVKLRENQREDVDFRIIDAARAASVAVIAPHGGRIEPGTSEIAAAIAGASYSCYCFEGLQRRPHSDLHVTSTNFDEKRCLNLISTCDFVISVHGLKGEIEAVDVGGRDSLLRDAISQELKDAGFSANIVTTGSHAAVDPTNICNRGRRRIGVQLELTRGLRGVLLQDSQTPQLPVFADAVRAAISNCLAQRSY